MLNFMTEKSNMQNSNYNMSSIDKIYRSVCWDWSIINIPNTKGF